MIEAFEGNRAETATMLPTLRAFMAAHQLCDITVVVDAGMISDANKKAIEAAGLSFILGERIPSIPYLITQWHRNNPDSTPPDGLVLTQPFPAGSKNSAVTRSSTTSTAPIGHAAVCAASTSKSPRLRMRSLARQSAGQAQPVRHAQRRRQKRQP